MFKMPERPSRCKQCSKQLQAVKSLNVFRVVDASLAFSLQAITHYYCIKTIVIAQILRILQKQFQMSYSGDKQVN